MRICAIIPMFGFAETTNNCIAHALNNAGMDMDILVVDDGSSEPYVPPANNSVFSIRLDKNSGYTKATNEGIRWAMRQQYDAVLLLNNDTEPEPNFLKYLVEAIEADPDIGVAGSSRVIYGKDNEAFIENFGIDLVSGYQAYTRTDLSKDVVTVAWLPVCSALIPLNVFYQVGLLDRRMRIFCSDNDFCIRAQQMGYKIVLIPKSKVKHFHQKTTTANNCFHQATEDQKVLLEKLSCHFQKQLLDTYPISWSDKSWGKLEFYVYTKDKEPGNDKLNQLATA